MDDYKVSIYKYKKMTQDFKRILVSESFWIRKTVQAFFIKTHFRNVFLLLIACKSDAELVNHNWLVIC